jgi:hypothetical protein
VLIRGKFSVLEATESARGGNIGDLINNSGLSLGVGVTGLLLLLANRVAFLGEIVSDVQSRLISVLPWSSIKVAYYFFLLPHHGTGLT